MKPYALEYCKKLNKDDDQIITYLCNIFASNELAETEIKNLVDNDKYIIVYNPQIDIYALIDRSANGITECDVWYCITEYDLNGVPAAY